MHVTEQLITGLAWAVVKVSGNHQVSVFTVSYFSKIFLKITEFTKAITEKPSRTQNNNVDMK